MLVHAICDWVRQNVAPVPGNTNHLPNELKTKPGNPLRACKYFECFHSACSSGYLILVDDPVDPPKKKEDVLSVMLGLFPKDQIKPWTDKKNL